MNTFCPYPNFKKSLECLDRSRLGKQRVEAKQIIDTLEGRSKGWKNHPAVKMWKGYLPALKTYYNCALMIWISRGYKNNMEFMETGSDIEYPPWFGNEAFHDSHKSKLLQKNEEFYSKYKWDVEKDLDYVWEID